MKQRGKREKKKCKDVQISGQKKVEDQEDGEKNIGEKIRMVNGGEKKKNVEREGREGKEIIKW